MEVQASLGSDLAWADSNGGGTDWGALTQAWSEMGMDWYRLITQKAEPAPRSVVGQIAGADLGTLARQPAGDNTGLLLLVAAVLVGVLLLRR